MEISSGRSKQLFEALTLDDPIVELREVYAINQVLKCPSRACSNTSLNVLFDDRAAEASDA